MAELRSWDRLPRGGTVVPGDVVPPATGGWRTVGRPEIDYSRCVNCLLCWLYCPDSAVLLDGEVLSGIEYDYCKGCEICAEICPVEAIAMVPEDGS
jgi:pyruvate ferredoxin oxidoreductase delta subunit